MPAPCAWGRQYNWGPQPNGDSRQRRREHRPRDTRGSGVRVTSKDETTEECTSCNIIKLVSRGQYKEALDYIRTKSVNSVDDSKAKLQRYLQKTMIMLITDRKKSREALGLDYADVMVYLLSVRLDDYNVGDDANFSEFFGTFLKPDYTGSELLKLVNKHATSFKDKQRMWKIMFQVVEKMIADCLELIDGSRDAGTPEYLKECRQRFARLVEVLPPILHDDSNPAVPTLLHDTSDSSTVGGYFPLFAKAVELRLVPEARLLFETGAVSYTELTALGNDPEVEETLSNEADQSETAVLLRTVLWQLQSLERITMLKVSRLVGQEVLGREDRMRKLNLPSLLSDALLFRPQLSRYRKAIGCTLGQSTDGVV